MEHSQNIRRFRANPVEVAIFSIVTLVFANSVYNLFYDRDTFHPKTLTPMEANPLSEGKRTLASAASANLFNLDVPCDHSLSKEIQSDRVRLLGTFCDKTLQPGRLLKSQIVNNTNHFNATVFTDTESGKYSTDYIPLEPGENGVHLEFSFLDGKSFSQEINISRHAKESN
jgi:hypothetical protein